LNLQKFQRFPSAFLLKLYRTAQGMYIRKSSWSTGKRIYVEMHQRKKHDLRTVFFIREQFPNAIFLKKLCTSLQTLKEDGGRKYSKNVVFCYLTVSKVYNGGHLCSSYAWILTIHKCTNCSANFRKRAISSRSSTLF
jgi:hypothetical protein